MPTGYLPFILRKLENQIIIAHDSNVDFFFFVLNFFRPDLSPSGLDLS